MHDDATYRMSMIIQFHRCQFQDIGYFGKRECSLMDMYAIEIGLWCCITKNNVAHGAHNEGYYLTFFIYRWYTGAYAPVIPIPLSLCHKPRLQDTTNIDGSFQVIFTI